MGEDMLEKHEIDAMVAIPGSKGRPALIVTQESLSILCQTREMEVLSHLTRGMSNKEIASCWGSAIRL